MKLAQSAGNRYEKIHKNPLPGNYVFSLKVLAIKLCENNFTLDFYTNTAILFRICKTKTITRAEIGNPMNQLSFHLNGHT